MSSQESPRPSAQGIEEFGDAWFRALTPEAIPNILEIPSGSLTQEQRDTLLAYVHHFIPEQRNVGAGASSEDTIDPQSSNPPSSVDSPVPEKRRVGRPKTKGLDGSVQKIQQGDSWAAVRKLNALSLPEVLDNQLSSNIERDASLFISINDAFLDGSTVKSPMEALVSYCISLKQWESQEIIIHVRWLFMTLLMGDIGRLMFGKDVIIDKRKKAGLQVAIERHCSGMEDIEKARLGLGTQDLATKVYQASQTMLASGNKLVWLCEKFGTGCLFWLSQTLTNHFITNRVTKVGYAYEDAMVKLNKLQLAETAKESGTNDMGDAIRSYLRRVYRVDEIGFDRV